MTPSSRCQSEYLDVAYRERIICSLMVEHEKHDVKVGRQQVIDMLSGMCVRV